MTKNRGACALTRAGRSLYTIKFKSAHREPDLSILGLDPVSLSKIETHLLASLGSKGKNRNSLACLRNAGFYSAVTYCTPSDTTDYRMCSLIVYYIILYYIILYYKHHECSSRGRTQAPGSTGRHGLQQSICRARTRSTN